MRGQSSRRRRALSGSPLEPEWKAGPAVPKDAVVALPRVSEAAERVKALCNRCMFHVERCTLNVLYAHLEGALGRAGQRPMTQRPSEAA